MRHTPLPPLLFSSSLLCGLLSLFFSGSLWWSGELLHACLPSVYALFSGRQGLGLDRMTHGMACRGMGGRDKNRQAWWQAWAWRAGARIPASFLLPSLYLEDLKPFSFGTLSLFPSLLLPPYVSPCLSLPSLWFSPSLNLTSLSAACARAQLCCWGSHGSMRQAGICSNSTFTRMLPSLLGSLRICSMLRQEQEQGGGGDGRRTEQNLSPLPASHCCSCHAMPAAALLASRFLRQAWEMNTEKTGT